MSALIGASALLLGAVVAGAFAYVVVRWFLSYMKEHNTGVFIGYRILLGVALLALLHYGLIKDIPPKTDKTSEHATGQAAPALRRSGSPRM